MIVSLRPGELWLGSRGLFWGRITGIELGSGRFYGFAKQNKVSHAGSATRPAGSR
jgi:hypothetical protein